MLDAMLDRSKFSGKRGWTCSKTRKFYDADDVRQVFQLREQSMKRANIRGRHCFAIV
jgi:hypothetical protein